MKKIMTLLAVFLLVAASQAQTLQSFFDKYGNDERFEYVSVGKGMMNIGHAFGGNKKDNNEMMSKMKSVKILTLNADANSTLMKSVVSELDQVVEKGNFETAVEARDKGERVHIYYRFTGKDNADMLIVTKEKGEFSLIWITGKMTKEEMMHTFSMNGKMMNTFGSVEKSAEPVS
ncbi:MAG: DUF4252 domain-containing protein [Paludibacter sp.]|nr:DUF4252 domain-containing protein [Paludibacter sp.]